MIDSAEIACTTVVSVLISVLCDSHLEDVSLREFIYLVFTHMRYGVTVGDSGLYGCVPCLSSTFISLC